jgi:hypothetical protein
LNYSHLRRFTSVDVRVDTRKRNTALKINSPWSRTSMYAPVGGFLFALSCSYLNCFTSVGLV